MGLAAGALLALVAGCGGGGLDPILGTPGAGMAPVVTATSPATATPPVGGVATNANVLVTFSKPMNQATLTPSTFLLACPAVTGITSAVTYDTLTQVATLNPDATLPAGVLCLARVTTGVKDTMGLSLASQYTWSFTTSAAADLMRPTVQVTVPPDASTSVATNSRVSAAFSEDMNPTTINSTSFLLTNTTLGTAVPGSVTYTVASRTALFVPGGMGSLSPDTSYTAMITTGATDLAGNALAGTVIALPGASNYVWTFRTGALADLVAPTVTSTSPADGSTSVCLGKIIAATFDEPMDASTLTTATFVVTDAGTPVAGAVSYDALNRVASFTVSAPAGFAPSRTFVATVRSGASGVKDLAANPMAADKVWSFSTGTLACGTVVSLGTAAAFGAFGGTAGMTNDGVNTIVNGSIGTTAVCTAVTGFHDALFSYSETGLNSGGVNGEIQCAPPAPGTAISMGIAQVALNDAQLAWNALAAMPPGSDPGAGQLGGLVLAPGVYTAAGGSFGITTGDLTLDAQGDPNASWVFQMPISSLTVGLPATPRRVLLVNGALAKNVFWQVGSAARIEVASTMVGTIIAPAGVTISTTGTLLQTYLTGRAIGLTASVTMVNTTIVMP